MEGQIGTLRRHTGSLDGVKYANKLEKELRYAYSVLLPHPVGSKLLLCTTLGEIPYRNEPWLTSG